MDTAPRIEVPTVPGTPYAGGIYVDRYMDGDVERALIRAKKSEGHFEAMYNKSRKNIPGALSYVDGLANTIAMADAGSKIAEQILGLRAGGVDGWCIPAQDQLELCYRRLKPDTGRNWLFNRSGINLSAIPPTRPYTADVPAQTLLEIFRAGGPEAFELGLYWSSTQDADDPDWAWLQDFDDGDQITYDEADKFWVCAVRSVVIH